MSPRINPIDRDTEDPAAAEARRLLQRAWGQPGNLGGVLAHSLPATKALLDFGAALAGGSFGPQLTELVAIAVANENRCLYCLAAHTAAARAVGLPASAAAGARSTVSDDPKVEAALRFARAIVRSRGFVSDDDLADVRRAGYTDAQIVELLAHTTINSLTNYLHHISEVNLEFPPVDLAA